MPGAYAHITAVNVAREDLSEVLVQARLIIPENFEFVQLGALGPDFPYLDIYHRANAKWADAMHYERIADRILSGIGVVDGLRDEEKGRALAWLLGFTAHVVTDVTIHPVVKLKVGDYRGHETEHRICEMHQDVYIFTEKSGLDFHQAEFLKTMVDLCADPGHSTNVHPTVAYLWDQMFQRTDGALYVENEPHIDAWYYWFRALVGGVGDDRFLGLARHVLPWLDGVAYPLPEDVDRKEFIDSLDVPPPASAPLSHPRMHYDDIFSKAVDNIRRAWAIVASDALTGTSLAGSFLRDWDLDTGVDKSNNAITFWS